MWCIVHLECLISILKVGTIKRTYACSLNLSYPCKARRERDVKARNVCNGDHCLIPENSKNEFFSYLISNKWILIKNVINNISWIPQCGFFYCKQCFFCSADTWTKGKLFFLFFSCFLSFRLYTEIKDFQKRISDFLFHLKLKLQI